MGPKASEALPEYLEGYAELSEYIASDAELSMYKRFTSLSARNILYLQAEVQGLEDELRRLDFLDHEDLKKLDSSGMDILQAAKDWQTFKRRTDSGDERQAKKMKVVKEIRRALKEYQEAVVLQSQFSNLKTPSEPGFIAMTNWSRNRRPLVGCDKSYISESKELVVLSEDIKPDRLSRFMYKHLGYFFKEDRKFPRSWGATYYYPHKRIGRFVDVVSVLWSTTLILRPIYFFYYVKKQAAVLGMLSAFVVVFGLSVGFLTNARRTEVFAAVAAYAAVLVVFVSGSLGGSSSSSNNSTA